MNYARQGEMAYGQMEKINSELLTMTYGAIVAQLIKDYKDVEVVNDELEKMGYNIGSRLVEEFLAKSNVVTCNTFADTAKVIAKVAFKMFLGINADVKWKDEEKQFSLIFKGNPLNDFVQVPPQYGKLDYCNILCGVIRGALHMVRMVVKCRYIKSELKGANSSEIQVTLIEVIEESYVDDEM